jgi:hypothetical protein
MGVGEERMGLVEDAGGWMRFRNCMDRSRRRGNLFLGKVLKGERVGESRELRNG